MPREMSEEFIQSRQNPRVKMLASLREKSARRKLGLFAVEGLRELSRCVELRGVEEIYFCPELFKSPEHSDFISALRNKKLISLCRLSESAFEKVSNRDGSDGLIGISRQWECGLADLPLPSGKPSTILVADAIEKPGNLGAILRSADSSGADAVILTNPVCDIFNPAVVRASQGALFSIPVAISTPEETAEWLSEKGFEIIGAHLGAKDFIWNADFTKSSAIVVGCESSGLGGDWSSRLGRIVKIPMSGVSDSMNVGIAAAIFLYEAMRQKRAFTESSAQNLR